MLTSAGHASSAGRLGGSVTHATVLGTGQARTGETGNLASLPLPRKNNDLSAKEEETNL
jgi:hypothetical protein